MQRENSYPKHEASFGGLGKRATKKCGRIIYFLLVQNESLYL